MCRFLHRGFEGIAHAGYDGEVGMGAMISALARHTQDILRLQHDLYFHHHVWSGFDFFGLSTQFSLSLVPAFLQLGMMQQWRPATRWSRRLWTRTTPRVVDAVAFVGMAPFGSLLAGLWRTPLARRDGDGRRGLLHRGDLVCVAAEIDAGADPAHLCHLRYLPVRR